ncbi:CHASE2 domain-containing protein [Phormidium sp. CLA17]|uniref:CHASE2 domain-containing protein n=1 Tax=Leptolyngbya sp. Cla-17 TaxID=2803751 RepID=UPI001492370B|nr:CHASE2 domain-containing protein [Leptolyngbya sp. Cla-17]MBM0741493.1 CHASE2 domain-containing protein [Leptolyngbya sp. Cla-17]
MTFDTYRDLLKRLHKVTQKRQRVVLTALSVTSCVIAVRLSGLLQGWELATYDQMIRLRPPEPRDNRIVIITIDDTDLRRVGKYPIPDAELANLLKILQTARAGAIGLDIYRDLPIPPGHQDLLQAYQQNPNLIGITYIADQDNPEVPAPALLKQLNQVGFNNLVHDQDDKVRRGLLYWKSEDKRPARQSFGLVLALKYLQMQGIKPETAADQSGNLQLGSAIFRRYTAHDGAYILSDDGGYQILLNPRGPASSFRQVSLTKVLAGEVPSEVFRDRIVLVGYTAVSVNDFVFTSYSSQLIGSPRPITGVEFHANLISQIVGAAKDGRTLINSWTDPIEWLWIFVWAGVGAGISWQLRSPRWSTLGIAIAGTGLVLIAYGFLIIGWWIPVVPPLVTMTASAIAIIAHIARVQEELQRSKEFLNTIINTIPDPIFVKDRNYRWVVLNEAFSRFLGYPLGELIERSDYDVFSQAEADIFRQQDDNVFRTEQECRNEEAFTDRKGFTHHIETKRSLHKDSAGNCFLVGIIRDITERKRMEDELKRTTAELVQSNAELQRSATQLSHVANHDSLTGLPNRKLFHERLEQAILWAKEKEQLVALLFLDL